jgi:hypothetical protein
MNELNTFLLICRCLAFANNRDSLRKQFQEEQIAWENLVKVSNQHLVTPALYWTLSKKGLLNALPDNGLVTYLERLFETNRYRNQSILLQVHDIVFQLNQVGIEPLLMKGVASLITGIYPDAGIRMMTDIDLLIPEDKLMRSVAALENIGYQPMTGYRYASYHHQYVPLVCKDTVSSLELHSRIVRIGTQILPTAEVWHDAQPVSFRDTKVKLPSTQHRIQHNIIHTYMMDANYSMATINLMQLYEFAMLRESLEEQLNWQRLATRFKQVGQAKLFNSYVAMAYYLFDQPLHEAVSLLPSAVRHYQRFQYRLRHPWFAKLLNLKGYFTNAFSYLLISPKVLLKLLQPSWYVKQLQLLKKL